MKFLLVITILLFLVSCKVEESPINYGKDSCKFCKMNIVDKQHAAEMVTQKGKPFKYDAIECMVRDLNNENDIALFLFNDYSNPGILVDAKSATYLISENLPSPMGANLTGFQNLSDAELVLKEKQGKLFTWNELLDLFSK